MKILQVIGYKNAGKTTLVSELVRCLSAQGMRVGTLKHDGHDFEPDMPGTDTWQHRKAGAQVTAITSAYRTAWHMERATPVEELVSAMEHHDLDFLIVEGFKTAPYPKIALLRNESDIDLLRLPNIIAVALREPEENIRIMAKEQGYAVFTTSPDGNEKLMKYMEEWFNYNASE